jgi:Zn-dependent protease
VSGQIAQVALAVVAAILAITLHESAHGYAALALGDDTARRAGRLSLNPLRHVDRVGTILLPGFLLIAQLLTFRQVLFMFGWAKPVPVSAWKFHDPRRGMMLVATAGPLMNFCLAWLAAVLLPRPETVIPGAFAYLEAASSQYSIVGTFLADFILFNLVLGLFNLIPIPPLDGGRIAVGLLPIRLARAWAQLERAGIIVVLLVVLVLPSLLGEFGIRFDPFRQVLGSALAWATHVLLTLSGHHLGPSVHEQFL